MPSIPCAVRGAPYGPAARRCGSAARCPGTCRRGRGCRRTSGRPSWAGRTRTPPRPRPGRRPSGRDPFGLSLLVVAGTGVLPVWEPAVVSLLPAPHVSLLVAEFLAGLEGDTQGPLALGVGALRVVVLGLRLAGAIPLFLFELLLALAEVRPGRAVVRERASGAVALAALRALPERQLRLERLLPAAVRHA